MTYSENPILIPKKILDDISVFLNTKFTNIVWEIVVDTHDNYEVIIYQSVIKNYILQFSASYTPTSNQEFTLKLYEHQKDEYVDIFIMSSNLEDLYSRFLFQCHKKIDIYKQNLLSLNTFMGEVLS